MARAYQFHHVAGSSREATFAGPVAHKRDIEAAFCRELKVLRWGSVGVGWWDFRLIVSRRIALRREKTILLINSRDAPSSQRSLQV
jgi:hypothetical protein